MKKILVIGNSFGVDATRYLYGIARAAKDGVKVVTLYIGGCSLYRHYRNMLSGEAAYEYYLNGMASGIFVSLKEALLSDEWDAVVMQQCSPDSGDATSYYPYINELSAFVKKMAPAAKQYVHETWSFAEGCPRFSKTAFATRAEMIPAVRKAYRDAEQSIGADGVIPSLDAMCKLYDVIGERTYRDGYHCHFGVTRYMLGCVWYMVFFGKTVTGNTFRDFDVEVSEEDVLLAQRCAQDAVTENRISLT